MEKPLFVGGQLATYAGHEEDCDCAVCEDIAMQKSLRKDSKSLWQMMVKERDAKIEQLENDHDSALGKIARLQVDLHQTVVDCERYKSALTIISRMGISGLSWQYDYEKCVNIATEALKDHGCDIQGAKVCFACGECLPEATK